MSSLHSLVFDARVGFVLNSFSDVITEIGPPTNSCQFSRYNRRNRENTMNVKVNVIYRGGGGGVNRPDPPGDINIKQLLKPGIRRDEV